MMKHDLNDILLKYQVEYIILNDLSLKEKYSSV